MIWRIDWTKEGWRFYRDVPTDAVIDPRMEIPIAPGVRLVRNEHRGWVEWDE